MAVETSVPPAPAAEEVDGDEYLEGVIERLAGEGQRLVLSIAETASMLGISRGLAYDLARRGELPTMQLGRRLVVPRTALASFIASRSAVVAS